MRLLCVALVARSRSSPLMREDPPAFKALREEALARAEADRPCK